MGTGYTGWDCVDKLMQGAGNWHWALKFAWLPAKMDSGEFIWWKEYYHGVRIITGPGTPVVLHQYMTIEEFTWSALTQI